MAEKRKCSRGAEPEQSSFFTSPASAPPTAPPSSRSDPSTPFTPSSYFSKSVLLSEWWLIKSDTDFDGKRLAVGGLNAHGRHTMRVFNSAPIVKRQDAYTVETADGITVRIQGFINKRRTHCNGIPSEVSRYFLVGFPFNWDHYADGNFGNESISPIICTSPLAVDKQSEHLSDGPGSRFPIQLGAFLDIFTSSHDASTYDNLSRNFTSAPRMLDGFSPVNTALHDLPEVSNNRSSVENVSFPVETSRSHEMDKSNQDHSMRCADMVHSDTEGNIIVHTEEANCLGNGFHGERSEINNRVVTNHTNSLTVNISCLGQHEVGRCVRSESEFEKDDNLARSCAVNFDSVAYLPKGKEENLHDESTKTSVHLIVKGVSNDLLLKENLNLRQCNQLDNKSVKCQNHAEMTRVQHLGVSEDLPLRKDSVGEHSDSLIGKMSLPSGASFESPPPSAQRNTNNESTPNSTGLAVKIGFIGLSPNVKKLLEPKYRRQLAGCALGSEKHAQRIRVDGVGDSEVKKVPNRNEADSLTLNTDMVLETARATSLTDKEKKLNDMHTISSADFAVERVSDNLLSTERNDSHCKLGSRREGYALRSRNCPGKIGANNTGVSEDSRGRKNSEEIHVNSSILLFEPLLNLDGREPCKAPNEKRKGKGNLAMKSRLEVENECRSVTVECNTNGLGGAKKCGHVHAQSLAPGCTHKGTLVPSRKDPSSKHHYKLQLCSSSTPASPDRINKKGVDLSEHSMGLQAGCALGSEKHAQKIRVDGVGDSEAQKVPNRSKADSLTLNTDIVLKTARTTSPTDEERKLNNMHTTSSADFAIERVSDNLLSTEKNDSHCKLGSRREGYALRSRNRPGKAGANNTGVSKDSRGRKNSEEIGVNSLILLFEPLLNLDDRELCKAPNEKWKGVGNQGMISRLEVENECRSVTVECNTNGLGGAKRCGHVHARSPAAGCTYEGTLVSSLKEPSSKHHCELQLCSSSTPASPDIINKKRPDHSEHSRGLKAGCALGSEKHAQRIRMNGVGDSEVQKVPNRNKADSLTLNTDMVLKTARTTSPTDKERKLNNMHNTSSANFAVERVSDDLLSTKRNDSHCKLGSRREGYALRSRNHPGKIAAHNTGVSEDSRGRKNSEESHVNSSILLFEPLLNLDDRELCKAPNEKWKGIGDQGMVSGLEVENECRSVTVECNTNGLGGAKRCGHVHAQSPHEGTLVSSLKEPSSKHHPASPDRINKKGPDHSEHSMGLQKSSGNDSFKTSIPCSVKQALHSDSSVGIHSDKASDITGKRIEGLPKNKDGNQTEILAEAQQSEKKTEERTLNTSKRAQQPEKKTANTSKQIKPSEKKTPNTIKRQTVWRPSYLQEAPLTREMANKLSITSPELLNLKRSRSGRLLVPQIARWCQEIVYDKDGTITGVTGVDILNSPCKGSNQEPQKKRKPH